MGWPLIHCRSKVCLGWDMQCSSIWSACHLYTEGFYTVLTRNLKSRLNNFICFQSSNENVKYPKEDKYSGCDDFDFFGSTQLSPNSRVSTSKENENGNKSFNAKNCHRKTQAGTKICLFKIFAVWKFSNHTCQQEPQTPDLWHSNKQLP